MTKYQNQVFYRENSQKSHFEKPPPKFFPFFMLENSFSKQKNGFGEVWVVALVWDANGDDFGFALVYP